MIKRITLFVFVLLLLFSLNLFADKKRQLNSWKEFFPDRLERVYIIMKDGTIFKHTSHYEDRIYMSMERLQNTLKKKDYTIKDIAIIIHNHLTNFKFSPTDHKEHRRLKRHGFNGLFLLYSHMTNKAYDIEENKKGGKKVFPWGNINFFNIFS